MPFNLTDADISIIKELLKDGRKSFREISRSTGISTPTVKARFDRLVNVGFIKSVSPIFDLKKIDFTTITKDSDILKLIKKEYRQNNINEEIYDRGIKKDLGIQLICDFCRGSISGKTHVLKFANFERFFCCANCRTSYKEKYSGRIEALKKRYNEDE